MVKMPANKNRIREIIFIVFIKQISKSPPYLKMSPVIFGYEENQLTQVKVTIELRE